MTNTPGTIITVISFVSYYVIDTRFFTSLKAKLAAAMVYTKVGKKLSGFLKSVGDSLQSKGIFNTWMLEEQDSIQAFAKSYADRYHGNIYQLSPQECTVHTA